MKSRDDLMNAIEKDLQDNWLTTEDAAALLGVSTTRVRQLAIEGTLEDYPVFTNPKRVSRKSVEKLLRDPERSKRGPKKRVG